MKKIIFIFFLFLLLCNGVFAQTPQEQLKKIHSSVIEKIDGKDYYIHTIKRGQTLYMISKAYGVDVNDIIRENPVVKEGIKADQKIRIPKEGSKIEVAPVKEKLTPAKPSRLATDTIPRPELPCGLDSTSKKTVYSVALMIPLYLNEFDQIEAGNDDPGLLESCKSFQFLPFYEGFRLALDTLEKKGIRVRLWVYDMDKDTVKTRQILKNPELKKMDLIVGVLYHQNFQIVADFAKKNKIVLVNPISERSQIIQGNPFIFKTIPSKKTLIGGVSDFMAHKFSSGHVLILKNSQYQDREAFENLKKECQEHQLNTQIIDGQVSIAGKLSKEKHNYLVVFTSNAAFAVDLTRRLYELKNEYDITLLGLPDWSKLVGLETEYLVGLKTHQVATSFIDYENGFVKQFVGQYQKTYNADPEILAFQGFDVAWYFLSAMKTYGTNFQRCLGEFKIQTLQNQYNFQKSKGNGFENQHWEIYKYENYKLVSAN
ncbi:MAG: ABC transporter substrate-binding protein [Bacteroidales bacterium]|nr:ABC transporter substrate-binding protein [Bacteroidales bacterium]